MSFVRGAWEDRELQDSTKKNKRTITDAELGNSEVVKLVKAEGKVYEPRTEFNASNMNDLEDRVEAGFDAIEDFLNPTVILNRFYPIGVIYTSFDATSPATLFGGTWENISGGLLMGGTDLPTSMIDANHHVQLRYTPNYNNQTFTPDEKVNVSKLTIGVGHADMPLHSHTLVDNCAPPSSAEREEKVADDLGGHRLPIHFGSNSTPNKTTSYEGSNSGHTHPVTKGNVTVNTQPISVNIEKPSIGVYMWVRVA